MTEAIAGGMGTVVIGLGSPLMADDGLGCIAVERLARGWAFQPAPALVDGGTWGMNLLPVIEDAQRVLLVDAINVGAVPGTLITLERAELPRFLSTKISPHQIDLREVLAVAEFRGSLPLDTVAMGIQPQRIEMGTALSPVVVAALPALLARLRTRLTVWGHRAVREAAVHA